MEVSIQSLDRISNVEIERRFVRICGLAFGVLVWLGLPDATSFGTVIDACPV